MNTTDQPQGHHRIEMSESGHAIYFLDGPVRYPMTEVRPQVIFSGQEQEEASPGDTTCEMCGEDDGTVVMRVYEGQEQVRMCNSCWVDFLIDNLEEGI
jgi:hypothetical protein